jgi:probable F420-dependent oxidoreductase
VPEVRWGLTLPFAGVPLADHEPLVRRAEAAGYHDLWSAEATGYDGFAPLALCAAWTQRVRLISGVVNPYTRGPALMAQSAAALADASRGRFVLGIGSSSDVIVERWNQVPFVKPLSRVREAVESLRPVLSGGRGPGGFKLESPPPEPVPIVIAALRDRMLRLAGEIGDGAFLNFLPVSAVPHVVERIREGEAEAGKEPGSGEVACRFFTVPQPAEEAIGLARFAFAAYATVPVYEAFFRALGWGERLDPMVSAWRDRDRQLALERAPDELIREIFLFGSPDEMRARLEEFAAGGITSFTILPMCPPDALPGLIDGLAP